MSYLIHDCETTIKKSYKRTANPFDKDNWVVANGFKRPNESVLTHYYDKPSNQSFPIHSTDKILVGFNYKFDLLWHWHLPELQAFLKRGGRIWCCQYAEYLLEGQDKAYHMCAMDDIVEKYGGHLKIDEVKAMWKAGISTEDIPKDLLLRYLGGKEGDIANTEIIYKAQVKRAKEQGQLVDILQRMEGLLATTMMEYNGLYIDTVQAYKDKEMLEQELIKIDAELNAGLPELPPEYTFNWGSSKQKSALLFGGAVKYKKWIQYKDDAGNLLYGKTKIPYVMQDGKPIAKYGDPINFEPDVFKGGKRKGEVKTKQVEVPNLAKPKGKIQDLIFVFPKMTEPEASWKGDSVDAQGEPTYSTGKDIIDELGGRGIAFLDALANRSKIAKDLGTYYLAVDKSGKETGMLTCVMPNSIIHHGLNHTNTVTSRLSSANPNLQNVTRPDWDALLGRAKSVVKRMFKSRFGDEGEMTEADYSQLEVVVQGLLTRDPQLIADLIAGIDFHCKRLSAKEGIPYEDVIDYCKVQELAEWKLKRTKTKEFTFQRAFGAALKSIAAKTGMPLEEVEKLSAAEELLYPGITKFYDEVEDIASKSRVPTQTKEPLPDKPEVWINVGKGFYLSPTKARFTFYEKPSPAWLRKKGVQTSLYRPHIQNYPIQGVAAQIVQYVLGMLFRHFIRNGNYSGQAFLVNTVHDCVWVDHKREVREQVRADLKRIMQAVPLMLKKLHNLDLGELQFPVDVETGPNMMELK